ncbi:hypothetical protein MAPG_12044, partial [Magnaporthiopsis poae ATCC 64411]
RRCSRRETSARPVAGGPRPGGPSSAGRVFIDKDRGGKLCPSSRDAPRPSQPAAAPFGTLQPCHILSVHTQNRRSQPRPCITSCRRPISFLGDASVGASSTCAPMIQANLGHLQRWRTLLPTPSLLARRSPARLFPPIALGYLPLRLQTFASISVSNGPHSDTRSPWVRRKAPFPIEPDRAVLDGSGSKTVWAPDPVEADMPSDMEDISWTWDYDGMPRLMGPRRFMHYIERPPPPPLRATKDWKEWKRRHARQVLIHDQVRGLPHREDQRQDPDAELRTVGGDPLKTVFNRWKTGLKRAQNHLRTYGPRLEFQSEVLHSKTVEEMAVAWEMIPPNERTEEFIRHMILSIKSQPNKTTMVIEALLPSTRPPPPYFVLDDMARFIVSHAADARAAIQKKMMQAAISCVVFILQRTTPEYVRLDQVTLHRMIRLGELPAILQLYRVLVNYDHSLTADTLRQFANRLAGGAMMEAKREALNILQRLNHIGDRYNINNEAGQQIATLMLSDRSRGKCDHRPAELMQRLLALGAVPTRRSYTALIQSLAFSGELQTAWMVYHNMVEQGIPPDEPLGHVLVAASAKANDINSLVRALTLRETPILGDYGWNLLLHTILHWRQHDIPLEVRSPRRFRLLMAAFCRIYNPELLHNVCGRNLGDHWHVDAQDIDTELGAAINNIPHFAEPRRTPESTTLRIMLVGYIRSLPEPIDVISFYTRIDELLKRRNPVVLSLVEEDRAVLYNTMMLTLSYASASRPATLTVMKSLLEDNPTPTRSLAKTSESEPPRRPRPNIHSWTIALDAILRDGDVMLASRHIRQMESYGCPPDQATWNVLVRGYARLQNVNRTVNALRCMEQAGFQADQFTISAFGSLRNKQKALSMLESFMTKSHMSPWVKAGEPDAETNEMDRAWRQDPVAAEFDSMYEQLAGRPRLKPLAELAEKDAHKSRGVNLLFNDDGWDDWNEQFSSRR